MNTSLISLKHSSVSKNNRFTILHRGLPLVFDIFPSAILKLKKFIPFHVYYFLHIFILNYAISSQQSFTSLSSSCSRQICECPLLSSLLSIIVGLSLGNPTWLSGANPNTLTALLRAKLSIPVVTALSTTIASVLKHARAIPA